jgi:hypothetical protein
VFTGQIRNKTYGLSCVVSTGRQACLTALPGDIEHTANVALLKPQKDAKHIHKQSKPEPVLTLIIKGDGRKKGG